MNDVILDKYSWALKRIYEHYPEFLFKNDLTAFFLNLLYRDLRIRVYCKGEYFVFCFNNGVSIKSYYPNLECRLVSPNSNYGYLKKYNLKKGDVVIDGGAYLGVFTLYAAKLVGCSGKVVAFEPDKINYEKLIRNINLNGLNNVIAINKGLSSDNAISRFYCVGSSYSSFFSDNIKNVEKNDVSINDVRLLEIPVVKLDDELKTLNILKVDLIKMDIEGAEIDALKGSKSILENSRVNLAIASYHIVNGAMTKELVEKILREYGYNVETTNREHLTTYGWKSI